MTTSASRISEGGERFALAGIAVLALAPALMVFIREAPPVLALLAAFAFIVAAARAEQPLLETVRDLARGPAGMILGLMLALLLASAVWSPAPLRGAVHAGHMIGSALVVAGLLIAARQVRNVMAVPVVWLGLGYALAAILLSANLLTDGALRVGAGLDAQSFRVNRAAVALAILTPLVVGLVLWPRSRALAMAAALLAMAGIALSDSASAQLALVVIAIAWGLCRIAPRAGHRLIGIAILGTMIATPIIVPYANDLIPQWLHDRVGYASLTIRGEIWREFAALIWRMPWLGHGVEASYVVIQTPAAANLTEQQLYLLNFGHPHNTMLQIVFELGLVGAALAVALVALSLRAMERLPVNIMPAASATAAGVYAVACVSHGAWQAWWPCLVGIVAAGFILITPPAQAR